MRTVPPGSLAPATVSAFPNSSAPTGRCDWATMLSGPWFRVTSVRFLPRPVSCGRPRASAGSWGGRGRAGGGLAGGELCAKSLMLFIFRDKNDALRADRCHCAFFPAGSRRARPGPCRPVHQDLIRPESLQDSRFALIDRRAKDNWSRLFFRINGILASYYSFEIIHFFSLIPVFRSGKQAGWVLFAGLQPEKGACRPVNRGLKAPPTGGNAPSRQEKIGQNAWGARKPDASRQHWRELC